jgi:uncharacterized protein (TIGR02147 family)
MSQARKLKPLQRPDVFGYHDYRVFLKEWIAFLKETQPDFSGRTLAVQADIPVSCLPMVFSGKRELSIKNLLKLAPYLQLSRSEFGYLENLVKLNTVSSFDVRFSALDEMRKYVGYQKRNPEEAKFFEYAKHWYYVAIREMALLDGFKLDPEWIQEHLNYKVSLLEVKSALEFLIGHGYIHVGPDGQVVHSKEILDCKGEVFTPAMVQYHKQMFHLASSSIENSPPEKRNIIGYTLAIDSQKYDVARQILDRAIDEIAALEKQGQAAARNVVYQVELALFPISKESDTK